eukprot:4153231-Pyramimonas_sp.AAC.1
MLGTLKPAEYASSLAISNRASTEPTRSPLSTLKSMRAVPDMSCRSSSWFSDMVLNSRCMMRVTPSVRLPCSAAP